MPETLSRWASRRCRAGRTPVVHRTASQGQARCRRAGPERCPASCCCRLVHKTSCSFDPSTIRPGAIRLAIRKVCQPLTGASTVPTEQSDCSPDVHDAARRPLAKVFVAASAVCWDVRPRTSRRPQPATSNSRIRQLCEVLVTLRGTGSAPSQAARRATRRPASTDATGRRRLCVTWRDDIIGLPCGAPPRATPRRAGCVWWRRPSQQRLSPVGHGGTGGAIVTLERY